MTVNGSKLFLDIKAPTAPRHTYTLKRYLTYLKTVDDFTVKVADEMEDIIKLAEAGYDFYTEVAGYKLFRRRK